MRSGPTIKDIARKVGVTPATVSYVLSQNPRQSISVQTRQKVLDAAREMGYVPNGAAKVLRNAPSYCVGVAIEKELMLSRFSLVLQGIRDRMESAGYNLMLCSFGRRHGIYPDYINNMLERRIDGAIFVGEDNNGPTAEAEELITRYQLPFVLYDCGTTDAPYSTVNLGYEQAGFDMASHMISQGARRLLYLRPCFENYQEQQREAGVRRAAENFPGVEVQVLRTSVVGNSLHFSPRDRLGRDRDTAVGTDALVPDLHRELFPVLEHFSPADGLIASWGVFSAPVCRLLDQYGIRIQVGALSDMQVPSTLRGRVSVCRLPGYQAGDTCASLLLARLEGDETPQARVLPMPVGQPGLNY